MSSTTVVRYITTTPNFSLGIGAQTTDQTRPGFANQFRKPWTAQSGYNSVTLNQVYSPANQTSPESGSSYIGFNDSANPVLISFQGISSTRCKATIVGVLTTNLSLLSGSAGTVDNRYNSEQYYSTEELFTFYVSNTRSSYRINGTSFSGYPYGLPTSYTFQSRTLTKSGSAITLSSPNQDQLTTGNITSRALIQVVFSASANLQETFKHTASFTGTLTRSWEGTDHIIDGLNGDNPPVITTQSILTAITTVKRNATINSIAQFTLQEQSQSVITGVDETLQNNFTLSATAKVDHRATVTLTQQTELLGTTFNFRFADPITILVDHNSTFQGNINRGLAASLLLSADANATIQGNMIYDISDEYSWNDFNILGYAISGYAVAGYLTDSADYSWTELDPVTWDTWTNAVWGGQEASWETWPEDVWNSTRTFLSIFSSQQAAHLIANGVAQLLASTSLSDNSAFRIEGVPAEIRSDFLCDGSPTGLIGGFSTITQDSILTGLANYIINNAQNIDGAFDATLLANYIANFLWSVSSDFSLAVTPTFKPGGVTNAQCITVVNALANAVYGPSKTLQGAFDPEFIARLFVGTDPYLIHKILQETRQIFVDAELRGIQIAQEIRLNSIPAEDRDYLVPQETRSMKLRIPPMTNRFTTPKVRTE